MWHFRNDEFDVEYPPDYVGQSPYVILKIG